MAVLLCAGLIVGAAAARHPVCFAPLTTVQLAVGSENVPLFQDPQVQEVFQENCFDVQVTGFGSRQMASIDFRSAGYDAVIPSSQITASQLEASTQPGAQPLKGQPEIPLFRSPLAIATYTPIANCLKSLGIASQDSQGIWEFSVAAYLAAVKHRLSWSDCGASLSPLTGKILVSTTNPQCSNSGEMFLADASYVANGSVVSDQPTAQKVGGELAPMITEQGFMENTTDVAFKDYLVNGMGYTPMVLTYESEFIGEEITDPGAMSSDMVLMYPTENVFSQRVLIPLKPNGITVGRLIQNDPELRRLAQELYGFRYSDPAEFQNIIGSHRIFGMKITVPLQITEGTPPDPGILEDVVNAAKPPPAKSAPAC
jgi:hypothetical protein